MADPTRVEREAFLELLLDLGGPLSWTGPIPYDALAARHAVAERERRAARLTAAPGPAVIPAQACPVEGVVAA